MIPENASNSMQSGQSSVPTIVAADHDGINLAEWLTNESTNVERLLNDTGAVLFRGFAVEDSAALQHIADSISPRRVAYVYRSTPRRQVADRIYTATEYPAQYEIPLHNENAYQRAWPTRLLFCCLVPAAKGGETPLARTGGVTERIDRSIRETFRQKGVMYVRNYHAGIDLPWETVFQTKDRDEVERYCVEHEIECEWRPHNSLRTRQVCQALARHPVTGEEFWFNQAHLFHSSSLDDKTRAALERTFKPDEFPRHACYGDGSPIETDALSHIRAAYDTERFTFPWQRSDVLLLDNMRLCHGRAAYEGQRTVLAAFLDTYAPGSAAETDSPQAASRSDAAGPLAARGMRA